MKEQTVNATSVNFEPQEAALPPSPDLGTAVPRQCEPLLKRWPLLGRSALALGLATTFLAIAKPPKISAESLHVGAQATLGLNPNPDSKCDALVNFEASDPLHTDGNKIVDAHRKQYMPVGHSIYGGLQQWDGLTPHVEQAVTAQIVAGAKFYGDNTLRFQVASATYFQNPTGFVMELKREVNLATCLGAFVVININPLFTSNEPAPTIGDLKLVKVLSHDFADMNNVFIDPENEQRLDDNNPNEMWHLWQDGGTVNGVRYIGMQTMVNAVRDEGNHNLVWVEAPHQASDLSQVKKYHIKGKNIVYEFHHPNLNEPSTWKSLLISTGSPRVEGEESQYSSSARPECYSSAYTNMPKLLHMLVKYHDGLVNWSLEPGVDVESDTQVPVSDTITASSPTKPETLGRPSKINKNYSCTSQGQGMGELFMNFSKEYSAKYDPYYSFLQGGSGVGGGSGAGVANNQGGEQGSANTETRSDQKALLKTVHRGSQSLTGGRRGGQMQVFNISHGTRRGHTSQHGQANRAADLLRGVQ
jgi:hypothetical protein